MKGIPMKAYIPIATYKLPGDQLWVSTALGIDAIAEGNSQSEAKDNLAEVLPNYISMLDAEDSLQAAELDYIARLVSPPEGVEWIQLELKPLKVAAEVVKS